MIRELTRSIIIFMGFGCLAGCGLYESPPSLEELGTCGICGPCGMGLVNCATESCEFEDPWAGVLSGDMACADILVVVEGASDEQAGSRDEPVGSIERALELAAQREAPVIALVGDGVWREEVVVSAGLALVGGVDQSLELIASRPRLIWESDEEHVSAITVDGASESVWIVGLEIEGRGGMTNYGIRVVDSDRVTLRDLRVLAGPAGHGRDGNNGDAGASGMVGDSGDLPRFGARAAVESTRHAAMQTVAMAEVGGNTIWKVRTVERTHQVVPLEGGEPERVDLTSKTGTTARLGGRLCWSRGYGKEACPAVTVQMVSTASVAVAAAEAMSVQPVKEAAVAEEGPVDVAVKGGRAAKMAGPVSAC